MPHQVFYDPRQARWKRLRRLFDIAAIAFTLIIAFFIYTAIKSEPLPEVFWPIQKKPLHALHEKEKDKAKERRRVAAVHRGHRRTPGAPSQVPLNSQEGIRAAFYVNWDTASFSSLREYAHQIDLLYPEWLHVLTPDGNLRGVDWQTNKYFDIVQNGFVHPVDDKVMPFLKSEGTGMEVFPLVNNFDGTNWVDVTGFLNDAGARERFRQQLTTFLASDQYRGLMVDFEDFSSKAQPGYRALMRELSSDLHSRGQKLYVSVQPRNADFDLAELAGLVDGVVVMDYDEHYPGGEPGPVASEEWFVQNLKVVQQKVPQKKIICAIGNYGYDWPQRLKNGKLPQGEVESNQSVQQAWLTARDSEVKIDFDSDALNPHITYADEQNVQHDIWYLDAVTALNEMRGAQALGIQTFALWRLGSEDRSLWKVWDQPGDSAAPDKLKDVPAGQDVDMEGSGEVLRIEARPQAGTREIESDSGGQITDENFTTLPQPYRVARYGASPNKIAITFDDGPDPEWTPKILDVLKAEHANATFFLIGIQADKFPNLTSRIYSEGNVIGNHTFSHPDISNVSPGYMRLEVNLTERLFASRLGMRTLLFRPPYSIDQEPDTEDQVRPLELTQDMGYTSVGDKIDPNDWRDNPRRTAEQISADVLQHLPPCAPNDQRCGNVILLHDGGGDRAETVKALPAIIEGIRAKGFEVVPLYELLDKSRADVMPPLPPNELWSARLNFVGFWLFDMSIKAITWIFFIGDILMTGRLIFIGTLAVFDRFRHRVYGTPEQVAGYQPRVAVIIPAYNEEKVIARTIHSVLASDYSNLHVIVVDDGSKDHTLAVARAGFEREQREGRVLILTKPNAGKAEALNYGLAHLQANEEIFIGIDADTIIAPDAIRRLAPHFIDPKIGAVAGNAKVGNRVNLWTRWQALEYITSQNFERRAFDTLGSVTVVPGAIGAWRTQAVVEAGGYHTDTVAEDADLTMAILRLGYRVQYEDLALAYTEAPTNANGLMRQRFRWSFGILQAVWKHRSAFARHGVLGWIALPNILIFQILLPLVSPFIDLMFAVGSLWYVIQKWWHPESYDPASFHRLVLFFAAFLIIDFITSAVAFALERRQPEAKEDTWLLSQVWLQRFAYRQLFSFVLVKTLKRALEGERFAWDKLERTAAVSYRPKTVDDSLKVHQ